MKKLEVEDLLDRHIYKEKTIIKNIKNNAWASILP